MSEILGVNRNNFCGFFLITSFLYCSCGKSLEEGYSEKYNICDQKIVDKEVGGVSGTVQEPSLFIYLLQEKAQLNKLKMSVTQDNGYSISNIIIKSDVLKHHAEIKGKGKYWSDKVSSKFSVPRKTYEHEIIVPQNRLNQPISFYIEVKYWWIWRGKGVPYGKFVNRSNTTKTTLFVK